MIKGERDSLDDHPTGDFRGREKPRVLVLASDVLFSHFFPEVARARLKRSRGVVAALRARRLATVASGDGAGRCVNDNVAFTLSSDGDAGGQTARAPHRALWRRS